MAKTYDTYKDSGIAWIGEIPGEWEVCRLKSQFKACKGLNITKENLKEEGYPVISYGQIHAKNNCGTSISQELIRFVSNSYIDSNPECLTNKGCFIFADTSEDIEGCGNAVYINSGSIFAGYHTIILKPKFGTSNKYLAYLFLTDCWRSQIRASVSGIKVLSITQKIINTTSILLPPLSVQQSISSFLDEKCGEIDSLISIQEEMISELLAYKQSVITEAVTKGLDKKAKMKNSGVEWIGDIPEEWEVIKIQYLNQGLTDGTHGTYNRVDKGRLLLSSKNVREKDLLITDSESQISEEDYQSIISNGFPKKGDLLMCCIGASIGRCIIYKYDETYAFQRSVIFIRCNKLIKPELLRYNLLSNNSLLQELFLINQSAQAGLYQGQVKEIKVIVPPISKQKQIIDYLDEKTSQIDSLIALKQSKIESLKEYKKSIIYEYVTGKKRV